jgi:hypothetical protein
MRVGDTYRIQVRLPPDYDARPSARWPVVYQLDGTSFGPQFALTAGHVSQLAASGAIPELIVVGIGYPYPDPLIGGQRGRSRDYQTLVAPGRPGGLDRFLAFVREELVPWIDARYRTTAERALSGHSLGGFVVLHTLLGSAGVASPLFSHLLACDPGQPFADPERLLTDEAEARLRGPLPRRAYYEIARYNGAVQRLWFDELTTRFGSHFPELKLETHVSDTDHSGVMSPCIERGLESLFAGGAP